MLYYVGDMKNMAIKQGILGLVVGIMLVPSVAFASTPQIHELQAQIIRLLMEQVRLLEEKVALLEAMTSVMEQAPKGEYVDELLEVKCRSNWKFTEEGRKACK